MCLIEVGQMNMAFFGRDMDFEPRTLTVISGRLIAMKDVPMCPGFRHLTVCDLSGHGVEIAVPIDLLVYIYCTGNRPKPESRNRNLPT